VNKTGFGFLRLPRTAEEAIDYEILNPMVDQFLALGGTYFDTAYTYLKGLSEEAIRKAVVERHSRERFRLANKLPGYMAKTYEDCQALFEEQLRRCGVDDFDVYLLHWLNGKHYAMAEALDEFRFLRELKEAGKAKRIGFSYHDGPELLDAILSKHPEVDYVQLQINYLDWDSVTIQARQCYEVAVKHGKAVIVMEPVKGGSLAALPEQAAELLRTAAPEESAASWAIRFATDLPQVEIVLSGMNTMAQLEDNLRPFPPLSSWERNLLAEAASVIRSNTAVPCTGCGYCAPNCPVGMPIPQYFALYNDYCLDPKHDWKMAHAYAALAKKHVPASACLGCGQCQDHCPQKIEIVDFLQKVQHAFPE